MSEPMIGQMDGPEFETLLEQFTAPTPLEGDCLPGTWFFEWWADIEEAQVPVDITGMIVEGQLVFLPPAGTRVPLAVHQNEIVVGGQVIRVHLLAAAG